MRIQSSFVAILAAAALAACGRHNQPTNAIDRAAAEQIVASGEADTREVGFGGKFTLLGANIHNSGDGLLLELVWKANGKQKLEYLVPIHALDAEGKIVGQADYPQDAKRREVADGATWRDDVAISREALVNAASIGIGLMGDGQKWLPPDRGQRDQDLLRLLLPIPADFSAQEESPLDGYLEAVNNSEIVGWVWQKGDESKTLDVEIYDGTNLLGVVKADIARDDLEKAGIGDGKHGFRLEMPPQVRDGQAHRIAARVADTKFELHKSPKSYQWKK